MGVCVCVSGWVEERELWSFEMFSKDTKTHRFHWGISISGTKTRHEATLQSNMTSFYTKCLNPQKCEITRKWPAFCIETVVPVGVALLLLDAMGILAHQCNIY